MITVPFIITKAGILAYLYDILYANSMEYTKLAAIPDKSTPYKGRPG